MRRVVAGFLVVGLVSFVLSGCEPSSELNDPKPSSESAASGTAGSSYSALPGEVVREYSGTAFGITVTSAESDGDHLVLSVKLRLVKEAPDGIKLNHLWSPNTIIAPTLLRIIDVENGEVFLSGESDEAYAVKKFRLPDVLSDEDEQEVDFVAYFGSPVSDRVSLMMPLMGMIHDVPVSRVDKLTSESEEVGKADAFEYGKYPLQSFEKPYEGGSDVRIVEESVSISIPSDILFGFASSDLSAEALSAIETAVASIRQYSSQGTLRVVGHTDDQDGDAINDPLSLRRAEAVAGVLGDVLGGSAYSIEIEGAGSHRPIASGTSEEARAANRRVEIEFAYAPPKDAPKTESVFPEAPPVVGAGSDVVTDKTMKGVTVQVQKVERIGKYLTGTFLLSGTGAEGGFASSVFSSRGGRSSFFLDHLYGMASVALLTESSRLYPADYKVFDVQNSDAEYEGDWEFLADRNMPRRIDSGTTAIATAVWPDLDPSNDSVTVEVPGRWRITDVPIEKGRD